MQYADDPNCSDAYRPHRKSPKPARISNKGTAGPPKGPDATCCVEGTKGQEPYFGMRVSYIAWHFSMGESDYVIRSDRY
jgi:hypothetical protein